MEAREGNSDNQRHSKKRKTEDENDDEKVEEFFALLRSTREARDRLRSKDRTEERHKDRPRENDKVNIDVVDIAGRRREKIHGVWSPTFRPEDFLDHRDDGDKLSLAGTSQTSPKDTKEENIGHVAGNTNNTSTHKGNLDLNLSL